MNNKTTKKKKIKKANVAWKWIKDDGEIKRERISITNSSDGSTYGRAWDYKRNSPANNNTNSVSRRSGSNNSRSSSSSSGSSRRRG